MLLMGMMKEARGQGPEGEVAGKGIEGSGGGLREGEVVALVDDEMLFEANAC
jgi:hypothetical protein